MIDTKEESIVNLSWSYAGSIRATPRRCGTKLHVLIFGGILAVFMPHREGVA